MTNIDIGTTCPDCGVAAGTVHEDGCDVARCVATGMQRLMCGGDDCDNQCGDDVWTGLWPGKAECREYGWWCQDRCAEGLGFVPCAPDAPGAMEDLSRIIYDCDWDPADQRWRRVR